MVPTLQGDAPPFWNGEECIQQPIAIGTKFGDMNEFGVTASHARIQSVPTLMLFRNGEVLWRTSGVVDKAELLATLDPYLRSKINRIKGRTIEK